MLDQTLWEYRVLTVGSAWSGTKDEDIEEALNAWGEEGWEAIAVLPRENSMRITVVAKRPLTSTARRQRARREQEG